MPISPYLARLRAHLGHERLFAPAITAIVVDDRGRVLLHRATDDGRWHTIGGVMDPGEQPAATVVREVREEAGLEVLPERLVWAGTTPVIRYPNGDEMEYLTLVFRCRVIGGDPHPADEESLEVRFFEPHALPDLPAYQRRHVELALAGEIGAFEPG